MSEEAGFGGVGGFDFNQLGEMLSRLGRAFSSGAGSSALSPETVRELAVVRDDMAISSEVVSQSINAMRVADLWLDQSITFSAPQLPGQTWRRSQWIDGTVSAWCEGVAPLYHSLGNAVSSVLSS